MSKRNLTQLTICTALAVGLAACAPVDDASPDENLDPAFEPSTSDASEVTPEGVLPFTGHVEAQTYKEVTTWFVELEHAPLVMGGDPAELDADIEGLRRNAYENAVRLDERFVFRGIVNGLTVRMGIDDVPALATLEGVRRIYPVGLTSMPELSRVSEPQLGSALGMTGADMVQHELGFDGTGIKVGVIDSGIDLQHPDLAPRIIGGFDFVGDAYDARQVGSVPVPEPGPGTRPGGDDCGGHGSHVAGIIGASGNNDTGGARGVAPGVGLAAYRVFGCSGSTNDDVIVAAIERAYEDGMDVINLSLGSDNGFPDDFLSMALSRVLELGMVPVASAGNAGRSGTFTAGSPAVGEHVISVASFDNLFTRVAKVQLSTGLDIGYTVLTGAPALPTSGESAAITYVGQGCNADTYTSDPRGKVAFITRGTCAFAEKYDRAYAAGAVGVVIENNVPGVLNGTLGGARTQGWGIGISKENGAILKTALAAGTVTLRFTGGFLNDPLPTGGLVSEFSSYGLTTDLSLKPDIGGPGGFIRSTYPLEKGGDPAGYAVLSGTSMASPYVTGAVALLMQARPDLPADQVRTVLQNSAEPKPWWGDRNGPSLDSVHRQGAGMVRIDRAILATSLVTPSKLSLGESQAGTFETTLYLENKTESEATYALGNDARPRATGPDTYVPTFFDTQAKVTFLRVALGGDREPVTSITVPAHAARSVSVLIEAPVSLVDGAVYGGYLTFTPTSGVATAVTVPYAGMKGDYQSLNVVAVAPKLLSRNAAGALVAANPGRVYTMRSGDVPSFSIGLGYGVDQISARIVGLDGSAWIAAVPAFTYDMMRRNNPGTPATFSGGDFDASVLPDGRYRIEIDLLRALGDADNPRHHQVVSTPWFSVQRPTTRP